MNPCQEIDDRFGPLNDTHTPDRAEDDLLEYWSRAATSRGRALFTLHSYYRRVARQAAIGGSQILKRLIDITVAVIALLVLLPFLCLVALAIKLEDGGPVFFRQKRVGLRGRTFGMWKFRSMASDAEALKVKLADRNEMAGGVTFKMKNDPRITRVGKWIRKFSIDEMPQFWNVLIGEMSLVGPRPAVPSEVEKYTVEDRQRLLARPGLTCFWQIGGRSSIDFAGQVRLDLDYIREESVALDLKLIFQTIPAVLLGRGAY